MPPMSEADDLNRNLGHQMMVEQRVETGDVSAGIDCRDHIFRTHSLNRTIPALGVSMDDAALDQTAEFSVHAMQGGPRHIG
jgi:hypothetical protein